MPAVDYWMNEHFSIIICKRTKNLYAVFYTRTVWWNMHNITGNTVGHNNFVVIAEFTLINSIVKSALRNPPMNLQDEVF